MTQQHIQVNKESKILAARMQKGTGVGSLLTGHNSETHFQDALQQFQKDYSSFDRQKRENQKSKRQANLQKKRLEYIERENRRWEREEKEFVRQKEKQMSRMEEQRLGVKRTANSNGLAYNPINLEYDRNPEGQKLRVRDQDNKIRGYVRAHNMDHRGNSPYNPLTGGNRVGVQKIIPNELNERYQVKLNEHYDNMRLKVPSSNTNRSSPRHYY